MAREIEADDAVIPREISRGDVPVMQVAPQAVNEDDGRPAAFGDVVDRDAVGRGDARLDDRARRGRRGRRARSAADR